MGKGIRGSGVRRDSYQARTHLLLQPERRSGGFRYLCHDVDLPFVFIDGQMHRRACRCAQTYLVAAGAVSVTRTLYRARRGERAVAALERKVGIVEGC